MPGINSIKKKIFESDFAFKNFLRLYSFFKKERFSDIEFFCLFIGYPYSGHTIIGSLLDAHPEVVISIEADVLGLIEKGFSRKLIYSAILRNNQKFNTKLKTSWLGYSYKVPGLSQGTSDTLRIIGDKKGAKTTNHLIGNISLLGQLEQVSGKPIKMIHIVRNPFDNIASMLLRAKEKKKNCNEDFFKNRIDYFFSNADMNNSIINKYPANVITIYHEEFIADPSETLYKLLSFLGLAPTKDYLKNCASIVRNSPHQTRDLVKWPEGFKELTIELMKRYSFFQRYLT
jgi:hypothetical protein